MRNITPAGLLSTMSIPLAKDFPWGDGRQRYATPLPPSLQMKKSHISRYAKNGGSQYTRSTKRREARLEATHEREGRGAALLPKASGGGSKNGGGALLRDEAWERRERGIGRERRWLLSLALSLPPPSLLPALVVHISKEPKGQRPQRRREGYMWRSLNRKAAIFPLFVQISLFLTIYKGK